jgi:hypothetical protein
MERRTEDSGFAVLEECANTYTKHYQLKQIIHIRFEVLSSTVNREAAHSSETLVPVYRITCPHVPEKINIHIINTLILVNFTYIIIFAGYLVPKEKGRGL